jgi:hypothetical protein
VKAMLKEERAGLGEELGDVSQIPMSRLQGQVEG